VIKSLNVHIGEVKTGREGQELHTILGSCIGIGFLWPKRGQYGLAHCLLPQSPSDREHELGGRYVDQAINTLCEMMGITNVRDIRAVVTGGANMTAPDCKHPEKLVGYLNTRSAIDTLDSLRIRILHQDTGCLLYTSPSPRDRTRSRMPSSA